MGTQCNGYPIYLFEYLAADLGQPSPSPIQTIAVSLYRGGPMAFNAAGDICVASFIDSNVQCFDTSTHALTHDYRSEIVASPVGSIQPGGLAFDKNNILYLTSLFQGQVVKENTPGGSFELLAKLTTSAPNELDGNLVLRGGSAFYDQLSGSSGEFQRPRSGLRDLQRWRRDQLDQWDRRTGIGRRSHLERVLDDLLLLDCVSGSPQGSESRER